MYLFLRNQSVSAPSYRAMLWSCCSTWAVGHLLFALSLPGQTLRHSVALGVGWNRKETPESARQLNARAHWGVTHHASSSTALINVTSEHSISSHALRITLKVILNWQAHFYKHISMSGHTELQSLFRSVSSAIQQLRHTTGASQFFWFDKFSITRGNKEYLPTAKGIWINRSVFYTTIDSNENLQTAKCWAHQKHDQAKKLFKITEQRLTTALQNAVRLLQGEENLS